MTINIRNCARCGEDHKNVELNELNMPDEFTHFCTCPKLQEPILVKVNYDHG